VEWWKSVKKLYQNRLATVNSVSHISGQVAIAEVWREQYESILNSVDKSKYNKGILRHSNINIRILLF
jgi:hypothetical protein